MFHFFTFFQFFSLKYIYIFFLDYKFDSSGSYYCRVLNSEQNETNSMSLGPKMREELSVKGSPNFGGFQGVRANGGGFEKNSRT